MGAVWPFLLVIVALHFFVGVDSSNSSNFTELGARELRGENELLKMRVRDLEEMVRRLTAGSEASADSLHLPRAVASFAARAATDEQQDMQGRETNAVNPLEGSENAVIVAGSLYSGATLLAQMLGSHPEVCQAGGPDGIAFDSADGGSSQVAEAQRACAEQQLWVATTTLSDGALDKLFKALPRARVVLLYRRGTEAVLDYVDAECARDGPGCSDADEARHFERGAALWRDANLEAVRWVGDSRVLFLEYELAVSAPKIAFHNLAAFLDVNGKAFGPDVETLASSAAAAIAGRKSHAARTAKHAAAFAAAVGDIPVRLGYGDGYSEEIKASWPHSSHILQVPAASSSARRTEQKQSKSTSNKKTSSSSSSCSGPPIVIAACGHSGTSLLVRIIGAHPAVYEVPGESTKFARANNVAAVKTAGSGFQRECVSKKKERWVEKTPKNVDKIGLILEGLPRAKVVVIYRNGRDVSVSLQERSCLGKKMCNKLTYFQKGAKRWLDDNTAALRHLNNPRVIFMQYEQLTRAPFLGLHNLCNFLDLPYEPMAMLAYHEEKPTYASSKLKPGQTPATHRQIRDAQIRKPLYLGKGKGDKMTSAERALFEENDGKLFTLFGYRTWEFWRRRRRRRRRMMRRRA